GAAELVERAGGAGVLASGPRQTGVRRRHTQLAVQAGARRRLPLAGEGRRPVGVHPVVVHDDADDLLDRVNLVVVDGHLESEPATTWNLHPVEGDPETLKFFQKGALVEHRRLEALNNCQCRRVVCVGCRHANLSFHLALRRPTVVFSKTLTSSARSGGSSSSSSSISFTAAERVRGCTVSWTMSPRPWSLSHWMSSGLRSAAAETQVSVLR